MAEYKGVKIPRGYYVAFKDCGKTEADNLAIGARRRGFRTPYDRSRAKVMKVGGGKKDYIVVMKKR